MKHRREKPNFTGLWETVSVENYEQYLTACGVKLLQRKLALLNPEQTHYYKHRGDDLQFSTMQSQGSVTTEHFTIGARTECTLPDGSYMSVRSAWDGDEIWVTTDDRNTYETRRWLDGEKLHVAETVIRKGEAPVTCRRIFRWVGMEPVWQGYDEDMEVVLANRATMLSEEDLIHPRAGMFCDADDSKEHPLKYAVKSSLQAAKTASTAISHSVNESWSTLETLFVDKPPPGEPDWHSVFGVDPHEKLHGAFNCALSGDITHQGRLYVFDKSIGFYSPMFGKKMKVLRAEDVSDVRKMSGLLPANAILIKTMHDEDTVFANFLSRDRAYDLLTKVLWNFTDDPHDRPPAVAVGFHTERYIFVMINSARGPAGGAQEIHDAFVRVRMGAYEACTPTVENSRAPKFNTVCCFPSTMFDPTVDRVLISLFDEDVNSQETLLGERSVALAGIRAAPPLIGNMMGWKAPAAWHKLQSNKGGGLDQLEISVSMWTASSAHPAFHTASVGRRLYEHKERGLTSKVKVYEEPRLAYLFLEVRKAHGLQARARRASGMADPYVHVTVGNQQARTHMVSDTLNPVWEDRFTFVVEKPLVGKITLELFDGDEADASFMGQVSVPLQHVAMRRGNTRRKPKPRWFRVQQRKDMYDEVAGRVLVGDIGSIGRVFQRDREEEEEDEDDGGRHSEHLGEIEIVAYLDSDYLPQEAEPAPVGQVAVEIVRARQLELSGELFAAVRYGRHWARLPSCSREPEWRQELVFPVRDLGDVVTIGLFRQHQAWALSAATEEPLGKARIRPGALMPGTVYRESVPLYMGHKDGLTETGSIDLVVKFVRFNAVTTMARYLALPLPPKCYIEPPAESTAGVLGQWEEEIVQSHLEHLDPPLSLTVQRFLRPVVDTKLSMRMLRVHVGRVLARFITDGSAGPSLLDPYVWWQNPQRMGMVHIVYLFLCLFPELIAPLLVLSIAAAGFSGRREAPTFGIDPWLSMGGQFEEVAAKLRPRRAEDDAGAMAVIERDPDDQFPTSLLDEALETAPQAPQAQAGAVVQQQESRGSLLQPEEQAALFRVLGSYAKSVQEAAETTAVRTEQVLGIFAWRDPLVSRGIFTALTLFGLALFVIPLRSVFIVAGLWFMRHPAFRSSTEGSRLPAFLSRLATDDDLII